MQELGPPSGRLEPKLYELSAKSPACAAMPSSVDPSTDTGKAGMLQSVNAGWL